METAATPTARDLWREAANSLSATIADWHRNTEEGEGPDVLAIEPRRVTRVWITLGGPSVYLDIDHSERVGEYVTSAPGYEHGATEQRVLLLHDECEEVCNLLGIEF